MKKLSILIVCLAMLSCTDQQRARKFGGKQTINLEKGKKLKNVTWKGDQLWVLTKEDTSSVKSIYHFKENSSFGIMEGEVIIIEQ